MLRIIQTGNVLPTNGVDPNVEFESNLIGKLIIMGDTVKKECTICNDYKIIDDFYKNHSECKSCTSKQNKKYRDKNKKNISNRKKEYRQKNLADLRQKEKLYRNNNKEEISNRRKEYYIKNCEKLKEKTAKYRENNVSKIKEYKLNNKSKALQYRKNNIEKFLLKSISGRAKKKNILIDLTINDIKNIMPKDSICPLLKIKMQTNESVPKENSFTIDRIDPSKFYTKDNIWIVSKKANTSKSNSFICEYENLVNNLQDLINNKLKIELSGEIKEALVKTKIKDIKHRSREKKLEFNLDVEYLKYIYPKDGRCPLLKIPMFVNTKGKYGPCDNSPSIDRIIPGKGYVKGNVIWISHKANTIKSCLSLKEMQLLLNNWKNKLYGERC
jgi:hypothetical protein